MRRWFVVAGLVAIAMVITLGFVIIGRHGSPGVAPLAERGHRGRSPVSSPPPSTLHGRISSRGAGIPGAIVTIETAADDVIEHRPALAIADHDGAWTLVVPSDKYIITASAEGFVPVVREDVEVAAGESRRVDVELVAGGVRVHGVVKDIGGGAIAGAHVGASATDRYVGDGRISTISRADGTYALTLPVGEFRIEASHDEYVTDTASLDVADEPATLDFALIPAGTMRGEVIARDTGMPVPGAIVYAAGHRDVSSHSATADERGSFVIDRLDGGLVDVFARGGGYSAEAPVTIEMPMAQHVEGVRVVVVHAHAIEGRVVDKKHPDHGIAHAKILLTLDTGERMFGPPPTTTTRDDGSFELEDISRGEYRLVAYGDTLDNAVQAVSVRDRDVKVTVEAITHPSIAVAGRIIPPVRAKVRLDAETTLATDLGEFKFVHAKPGKQTLSASTFDGRGGQVELDLGERDVSGVEVHLSPLATIEGKVLDTRGTAKQGFHVEALSEAQVAFGLPRATSGADGSFRLVDVVAGEVRLFAYPGRDLLSAGTPKSTKVDVAAGAQVTGVTVVVEPDDGVVRGKVISSDGTPVPDAWVTARARRDVEHHVVAATDGTFTLDHLRPYKYEIAAEDSRGARRAVASDVEPGATITITLAALATLTVHVDAANGPATGFHIECLGPGMFEREVTSPTGDAKYDHCVPATYRCMVSTDAGVASGDVVVGTGPARLDLRLGPWPVLSGTVVDSAGTPQPGVVVTAAQEPMRYRTDHVTDAHGRFEIARVVPGPGAVVLSDDSREQFLGIKEYTLTGDHLDLGEIQLRPPRE